MLVDPVFEDPHFEGTFRMVPARTIDAEAIRPDFVFVSHAHLDHFQPATLRRLAKADPDTVLVTADPFVAEMGARLGLRDARVVPGEQRIALHDVTVDLTPSIAEEPEWGLAFHDDAGSIWHQVDTVLPSAGAAASIARAFAGEARPSLLLARFQPMLEIAAQMGHALELPLHDYDTIHRTIRATNPHHVLPASGGAAHVVPWLNRVIFPVSPERFARDMRAAGGDVTVHAYRTGAVYEVAGDRLTYVEAAPFVEVGGRDDDPRIFAPHVPPLADPGWSDVPLAEQRDVVRRFAMGPLLEALAARIDVTRDPFVRVLRVPFADGDVSRFTFVPASGALRVVERDDPEADLSNEIAGSCLVEILAGRRSFASVLLAAMLRIVRRTYRITEHGVGDAPVAPVFLYEAIGYRESFERAVRFDVARLVGLP